MMYPKLKIYLDVSRPRFWIYIIGPVLLVLASLVDFSALASLSFPVPILFLILYLTYPVNLLIYGVNDIADRDTDAFNFKKGTYENLLESQQVKALIKMIVFTNLPFLLLVFYLPFNSIIQLLLFWFFSIFYSLKPIRAKAIPFLDSIFNVLYILPAISVYFALGGTDLNYFLVIAGILWVMAMHAYSAVPDIESDKQAGLKTSATLLRKTPTLIWCFVLYLGSAIISSYVIGFIAYILFVPYGVLMFLSMKTHGNEALLSLYKYFPYLNTICGMILFLYILLQRI